MAKKDKATEAPVETEKKSKKAKVAEVAPEPTKKAKKAKEAPAPEPEKKAKKAKGGGGGASIGIPSEVETGGGDGWNLTDEAEGELCLFSPMREDEVETKDYGMKPVIVSNVAVINMKKPADSEFHEEVYVFAGYLRGALRSSIGTGLVLGRLVKGDTKEKGNYPWKLEDPTAKEIVAAQDYLAANDPFAGVKKKSGK